MSKKDNYDEINTSRAYSQARDASGSAPKRGPGRPRKGYTPEEARRYMESGATSGRKGLKMPRINVAFDLDVYDYVKTMSHATGKSMTEFINEALRQHSQKNDKLYQKVLEFRKELFDEEKE